MKWIKKSIINLFVIIVLTMVWIPNTRADWSAKLMVGQIQFDSKFAQENGLGKNAWEVAGELDFKIWKYTYLGGGAGLIFLDDKRRLNQRVTMVGGPNVPFTAKSDQTGGSLYGFLKFQYPFSDYFSIHALTGYKHINFDREIDNCTNCPSEDVDIDAGVYFGGGMVVRPWNKFDLTLRYQTFLGDDVDGELSAGIGGSF